MTEAEEKAKCVKCGYELFSKTYGDKVFPPEKYNYCHSYCCNCCPHAKTTPCDKEIVDGNTFSGGVFSIDVITGRMKRWLPPK